ncbi:MAG TPA: ElyC/SanA/YdcF family protein [Luteolibacter sp.]|nr:ElyC/SanA/YdcF family protein [Luteolibacter sp.]
MKKKVQKGFFRRWLKRLFVVALLIGFVVFGIVVYANLTAIWSARGRIFTDVKTLPPVKVGLVFGTSDKVAGRENLYFRYRIDAAEEVWKAGKLETIIVSGDNRSKYYNEPEKMKAALVARGLPADRIVCDYAGLRTLDSVVRAKEIFGADPVLFISQRFQNERAIYLADAHGIEAYGFASQDVQSQQGVKTKMREIAARVQMWLDVHFLNTRPRHLGEKVELPE